MTQQKLPTSQGGRHFKPPHLEIDNLIEAFKKSTQQTPTKEEGGKDPYELIYNLLKCFMMTWEELLGITSSVGYEIWSEDVTKTLNYPTSIYRGRHFKPQQTTQHP